MAHRFVIEQNEAGARNAIASILENGPEAPVEQS